MKSVSNIIFVCLLLSLTACNLPRITSTPTPTPTNTATSTPSISTPLPTGDLGWGSVRGRITNEATGAPIDHARVICEHHSFTSPSLCDGETFTDQDGNYYFINVYFHDTDTIRLQVIAAGYEPQEFKQTFFTQPELVTNFALVQAATIITPPTPMMMCTPPLCAIGTSEVYYCSGTCPGGCGTTCATFTPAP